jgi:hypothetical protein
MLLALLAASRFHVALAIARAKFETLGAFELCFVVRSVVSLKKALSRTESSCALEASSTHLRARGEVRDHGASVCCYHRAGAL